MVVDSAFDKSAHMLFLVEHDNDAQLTLKFYFSPHILNSRGEIWQIHTTFYDDMI